MRLQVFIVSFQHSGNNSRDLLSHGFIGSISYSFLSNNYIPEVKTHFTFSFAGKESTFSQTDVIQDLTAILILNSFKDEFRQPEWSP